MKPADDIILCQPDSGKGCSVCCGLFNLRDTGRENLVKFLEEGSTRERTFRVYEEFPEPEDLRDRFSHVCPYQGFLAPGRPGCLIHPLSSGMEGRDRSLFASSVCGKFLCPAHELLSAEEKGALISSVDDWYLYSTAVIDPESFSFIYEYSRGLNGTGELPALITTGLAAHAENLKEYEGTLFFYSIPEYNINRDLFSLKYRADYRKRVTDAIENRQAAGH